ncbi:hypothetical protein CDD81_6763 [Ophiocordyceps australis]|uniref:Uncharacterized protein n=1 Tax=Ophiocordyceps australis TaxID=1399860 RepID=A0A2C5Y6W4_9HYPO|nr:hypothetical protein CDD81_6763 [Ophiocordyceps australis]
MPHLEATSPSDPAQDTQDTQDVIFPPVSKDHIQNCSYDSWFPHYRSWCLKSRIIPLPQAAVTYLEEDGIILADEDDSTGRERHEDDEEWHTDSFSSATKAHDSSSDHDEDEKDHQSQPDPLPPNKRFPETHALIKDTIAQLGGAVMPKLNWSSPKDAKWISPHQNTLKCTSPNDIYLMLKSSSFVTHDLGHAFDGCTEASCARPFTPVLVLRPFFSPHTALEFRCFVKHRSLIGISQRDLNYYPFLNDLRKQIWTSIVTFFRQNLRLSFPDANFVFDVYIPEETANSNKLSRVRLIDINPWAPRTDTLLFSWPELLNSNVEAPLYGPVATHNAEHEPDAPDFQDDDDDDRVPQYSPQAIPELRLVERDDPAAFNFSSPQYSAHKLPKDVVDASSAGEGGLREFARQWRDALDRRGS